MTLLMAFVYLSNSAYFVTATIDKMQSLMDTWMNFLSIIFFIYVVKQCMYTSKALKWHFRNYDLDDPGLGENNPLRSALNYKQSLIKTFTFVSFWFYFELIFINGILPLTQIDYTKASNGLGTDSLRKSGLFDYQRINQTSTQTKLELSIKIRELHQFNVYVALMQETFELLYLLVILHLFKPGHLPEFFESTLFSQYSELRTEHVEGRRVQQDEMVIDVSQLEVMKGTLRMRMAPLLKCKVRFENVSTADEGPALSSWSSSISQVSSSRGYMIVNPWRQSEDDDDNYHPLSSLQLGYADGSKACN